MPRLGDPETQVVAPPSRTCVGCKHYRRFRAPRFLFFALNACAHPAIANRNVRMDPLTGIKYGRTYERCDEERYNSDSCGKHANRYEPATVTSVKLYRFPLVTKISVRDGRNLGVILSTRNVR